MNEKIFFIPGLGANKQVFEKLADFGTEKVLVAWMKNEGDESLYDYSQRIIDKYGITKNDVVAGLSFGGLIAQQIGEILDLDYVILISSFRTKADLRPMFSMGLKLNLHRFMPEVKAVFISEKVANYLNSGTKESRPLLRGMIETTDMKLMKWSIAKIYEQEEVIGAKQRKYNLLGTKDRIVGQWSNDTTYNIENGSHFMVYDHAAQVSSVIREILMTEKMYCYFVG